MIIKRNMRSYSQLIPTRYRLVCSLFVLLAFFSLAGCSQEPGGDNTASAIPANTLGGPVTDFTIKTFKGEDFTLSAHRGHTVLINFWASWCGPCRLEGPALERLYKRFGPQGVVFVGVAVDDTEKGSLRYLEEMGWTFPAGPDSGSLADQFFVSGIPKTYIVKSDGIISYIQSGVRDEEFLARKIEEAMGR